MRVQELTSTTTTTTTTLVRVVVVVVVNDSFHHLGIRMLAMDMATACMDQLVVVRTRTMNLARFIHSFIHSSRYVQTSFSFIKNSIHHVKIVM